MNSLHSVGPQMPKSSPESSNLEPRDWEVFRKIGRTMVDDMADYLANIREKPVWQPIPDPVRVGFQEPLPEHGMPLEDVYEVFKASILPFPRGNIHPRFWGWVNGSGIPAAAYADFLASVINCTLGSGENAPMLVEEQIIGWLKQIFDWPSDGSGVLTSGCSMGQILAIAAARQAKASWDVRADGHHAAPKLTLYGSEETHHSIDKAVELLGLGRSSFRKIAVNSSCEIDIPDLKRQVERDRRAGYLPFCIIGNVGTVNTGAIDDLEALVSVAREEQLWLHLDGAFGAAAYLVPSYKKILEKMQEADSLVFDLHKWFYLPFDVSCVLIRSANGLQDTFNASADYISVTAAGPSSNPVAFSDRSIEQSRRFRALKVWFSLKAYGVEGFRKAISSNIEQARYLVMRTESEQKLQIMSTSILNIVCIRYSWKDADPEDLNAVNREILQRLQTEGIAVPSHTLIRGNFVIRVAINNHRTTIADIDVLVDAVIAIGDELLEARNLK